MISPPLRARINAQRVAHLATALDGEPALVPICFVVRGDCVYSAIDAKPKQVPAERLRRVRHLRANPRAAILVDHYEEDWGRLWFVLLEGPVRLLDRGAEHDAALAALRRRYPQYRTTLPLAEDALVIALKVAACRYWTSGEHRGRRDGHQHRARGRLGSAHPPACSTGRSC